MELVLFILFLSISFILITLGLLKPEHSELTLIGFTFLFLLSFPIINESITYKTGTEITSTFNYTTDGNMTLLSSSYENESYKYTTLFSDTDLSHYFGYWLAIISVVGFIAVIIGIRHSKNYE